MAQIHPQARTTPKIREEIKASTLSERALAKKYNVARSTVRKWKSRTHTQDLSHQPHQLATTLTAAEERVVVEIRKLTLLSLDDLLVITREFVNAKASRSGLLRCLTRHGVNNLKTMERALNADAGEKKKKSFKDYEPGFIHVDIKYLPKMPDEAQRRYLFVAIDRATRWVFINIYPDQTEASAVDFIGRLKQHCPFKIKTILTDNGTQFTDRFTSKRVS